MNPLDPLDLDLTARLAAVAQAAGDGVCPTGTTDVVARYSGNRPVELTWTRADELIHVSREVLREPGAVGVLATRYQLEAPCPKARGAWHARRRPEVDDTGAVAGQSTVTLGDDRREGDAP